MARPGEGRESIVRKGRLRMDSILPEDEAAEDSQKRSLQAAASVVPEFEIQELAGEGGTGEVFRAYDPVLKRTVALKILRAQDPQMSKRFLHEAQAQARIEHPRVCKVYSVGEAQGKAFIAMQFVNGPTLAVAAAEMSLEEIVRVVKDVCEALHVAHKNGLIHRDIKPGNILVERNEEGKWEPFITDFGLARELNVTDKTRTGMLVGTPSYMSPEQAQGDIKNLDRRSDIYNLGATLYELITGEKPFDGQTQVEVLIKIIQEDVVPLRKRKPSIPADLEKIVLKCLEKDPSRRYSSAKALGEDLTRYLEGEPVLARPTSAAARFVRKARRNKTVAAALMAAFVSFWVALYIWWTAAEQVKIAQSFGQEIERMESFLRYIHTLPLHDIRPQLQIIRQQMNTIEQHMKEMGRNALAPGHYALGQGYHILQEHSKSLQHLQKAWNSDYRTPEVAYAIGKTLGAIYQAELENVQRISDAELRETERRKIEQKFREPALQYLRNSHGAETGSPDYAEGLIAFYEKKYDRALEKSSTALRKDPWLYEAAKLKGDILVQLGNQKQDTGAYEAAQEKYAAAESAYRTAMNIARSDPAIYQAECERWILVNDVLFHHSQPSLQVFQNALAFCDKALAINSDNAEIYNTKSHIYNQWASHVNNRREDPRPYLQKAVVMAEDAIARDSKLVDGYLSLGAAHRKIGNYEHKIDLNPNPSWDKGIKAFHQAIHIDPNSERGNSGLAIAYSMKGEYETAHGLDPLQNQNRAVYYMEKAINLRPDHNRNWNNLGVLYADRAEYEFSTGRDPSASLRRALESYHKLLEFNPNLGYLYSNIGEAYTHKAEYEISQNQDPYPSFQQAVRSFQKAIAVNPKSNVPYDGLIKMYLLEVEFLIWKRKDPIAALRHAAEALAELEGRKAIDHYTWIQKAQVAMGESRWKIINKESPGYKLNEALLCLENSIRLKSSDAFALQIMAEVYGWKADWEKKQKQRPCKSIQQGLEAARQSLQINPRGAEVLIILGKLQALQAHCEKEEAAKQKALDQAKTSLAKALTQNHFLEWKCRPLLQEIDRLTD